MCVVLVSEENASIHGRPDEVNDSATATDYEASYTADEGTAQPRRTRDLYVQHLFSKRLK